MSDSVYYKATDEDGNTVLKHSWKKHKYLYIKNGKYVYPEDVKKSSAPYKGPTSAIRAQKAQHEKDFQKRVRAMNAHTVAKKKQDRQMKQIAANVKKQNAPSTKVKKAAKFATKVATRDAAAKMAVTKYLVSKAAKSPTANAARAKARSVVSKGEYKITRAGQKLARDVKKTGAYKTARKTMSTARDRAVTSAEVRNKANSVKSKAEYKLSRAGQKLSNDTRPYISSAKKKYNSVSKDVNKAYKSAKKKINSVSRDANKAYKAAKKKVRKARNTFNRAKRAGKAYLNYLTK